MIPSYPSPQQIGTRYVAGIFNTPVVIQEKIDGSQISFGLDSEGNLRVRSRGAELNINAPDKMFASGIGYLRSVGSNPTSQLGPWSLRVNGGNLRVNPPSHGQVGGSGV